MVGAIIGVHREDHDQVQTADTYEQVRSVIVSELGRLEQEGVHPSLLRIRVSVLPREGEAA